MYKKFKAGIIAGFFIFLVLSSVCVAPAMNKNAIENQNITILDNDEIYDICIDITNNPQFINLLSITKNNIYNEINKTFEDVYIRNLLYDFLNLDVAFNLNNIINNINNIDFNDI